MTAMEAAKQLTQQAIDKGQPDLAQPWAKKWYFEWFYGSRSNPTIIRSGCCGADNPVQARTMIREACPAEAADWDARLWVEETRLTWPRIVS
jgi:hypothetical protein